MRCRFGATIGTFVFATCAAATPLISPIEIIEKTRKTAATFTVISNVSVNFEGISPGNFIGGEFHSGESHRIEDANNRVVANCMTRQGQQLWLPTSKRERGTDIAAAACGIGPPSASATMRYMGDVTYKFGQAFRIVVDDEKFLRTYDVMPNGAIVRNVWQAKDTDNTIVYRSEVCAYNEQPLPPAMFLEAALDRTYLPDNCAF